MDKFVTLLIVSELPSFGARIDFFLTALVTIRERQAVTYPQQFNSLDKDEVGKIQDFLFFMPREEISIIEVE